MPNFAAEQLFLHKRSRGFVCMGSQYLCKIFNEGVQPQVSRNILSCKAQEPHVV